MLIKNLNMIFKDIMIKILKLFDRIYLPTFTGKVDNIYTYKKLSPEVNYLSTDEITEHRN